MPSVNQLLSGVKLEDHNFTGTIAFKSERITLPDGSKMALGIDDGRWVLINEEASNGKITCYEYNSHEERLLVDKQLGTKEDLVAMSRRLSYFFVNANAEDLVTIFPPEHVK